MTESEMVTFQDLDSYMREVVKVIFSCWLLQVMQYKESANYN